MTDLRYSGEVKSESSVESVMRFVTSPERLASAFPDVRSFELKDGSSRIRFSIDLSRFSNRKDISHIAALTATLNLSYETVEERHVVIVGKGRSAGSAISVRVELKLEEVPGGTSVRWNATVNPGIVLRLVGRDEISSISEKFINHLIEEFRKGVSAG